MAICKFNIDNFEYNIESNLAAMGLPLPKTIFGASSSIAAGLTSIDSALSNNGKAKLSAISKGGAMANKFVAISASYYAGAIIGSALMASNRATRCSLSELQKTISDMGLNNWWVSDVVGENPEILRRQ